MRAQVEMGPGGLDVIIHSFIAIIINNHMTNAVININIMIAQSLFGFPFT